MDGVTIKPDGHERVLVTFPYSPARVQAMGRIRSPLDKLLRLYRDVAQSFFLQAYRLPVGDSRNDKV